MFSLVVAFDHVCLISDALHGACDQVLTVLMDVGSDLERADSGGWTALHCACAAARASCVNALIMRGADPAAKTPEGQSPASLVGSVSGSRCTPFGSLPT